MKIPLRSTRISARLVAACLAPLIFTTIATQSQTNPKSSVPDEKARGAAIGRMLLDKQFQASASIWSWFSGGSFRMDLDEPFAVAPNPGSGGVVVADEVARAAGGFAGPAIDKHSGIR